MLDISICIVNTNNKNMLEKCLESIYATSHDIFFEIWVVDNASKDGSAEMVRKLFPEVHLIINDNTLGSSSNFNKGLKRSNGRYLSIIHEDTIVTSRMFECLIKFMDQHPKAGMVAPRSFYPDNTLDSSARRFPNLEKEIISAFLGSFIGPRLYMYKEEKNDVIFSPDWIGATCLMFRREAIEQVGFFDETIFIFYEEVDLIYRLRKAGWQIYYLPNANIIHYRSITRGITSSQMPSMQFQKIMWQSRYYFFKKHYGNFSLISLKVLDWIVYFLRIIRWSLTFLLCWPLHKKAKEKILLYLSGVVSIFS